MESRKLEIILHCAKGLVDVKHLGTMNPYAVFSILEFANNTKRTDVARNGDADPVWDCPIEFNIVPMQKTYTLFIEIKHSGKLFDRNIGEVKVSFLELLDGDGCGDRVSYPVTLSSGEIKGEIILSYKFMNIVKSFDKKEGDDDVSTNKVVGTPKKQVKKKTKGRMLKRFGEGVGIKIAVETTSLAIMSALALNGGGAFSQPVENDPKDEGEVEEEEEDEVEDDDYIDM